MAHTTQEFRVAKNPGSKSSRPPARKKGSSHMAKAGTKKTNTKSGGHRKAPNPAMHHKKKRKPNPSGLAATIGSPKDILTGGVAGLVSAIATRQLPQMLLSTANTGVEGYAANAVTALAMTWLAGTFAGPAAGRGALIGGSVILLDRVLSEQVSPISSYLALSGVGDAAAYSKLGTIRTGYFSHPNIQNPDGSMYVPDPVTDAAVAAVVAKYPQIAAPLQEAMGGGGGRRMGAVNPSSLRRHTANGMVLSSRFQGRFNQ